MGYTLPVKGGSYIKKGIQNQKRGHFLEKKLKKISQTGRRRLQIGGISQEKQLVIDFYSILCHLLRTSFVGNLTACHVFGTWKKKVLLAVKVCWRKGLAGWKYRNSVDCLDFRKDMADG